MLANTIEVRGDDLKFEAGTAGVEDEDIHSNVLVMLHRSFVVRTSEVAQKRIFVIPNEVGNLSSI
jgi:hypothetical protein